MFSMNRIILNIGSRIANPRQRGGNKTIPSICFTDLMYNSVTIIRVLKIYRRRYFFCEKRFNVKLYIDQNIPYYLKSSSFKSIYFSSKSSFLSIIRTFFCDVFDLYLVLKTTLFLNNFIS